jgi:hypothetical protein
MSLTLPGLAVMCWRVAPAAGEQREPAFAQAAQGPQQRVASTGIIMAGSRVLDRDLHADADAATGQVLWRGVCGWRVILCSGLGAERLQVVVGGHLRGAGAPLLARSRVDSGVDVDPEGPARQLLDVTSAGGGHGVTITRIADIRSTTVIERVRILAL